ncbi:uncharacterized protein LOC129586852 [Paramacrobiotus metropolitanus]|uniref:uncharacterized protein LOC129586852 n=1 Tax=Paramacrobiotus metropolitanus TaxID=2943436 RepID=UPI00244622C0|nr:uncharacterized protein LOC129586852 [Paramacrobiotus metropolitanus]
MGTDDPISALISNKPSNEARKELSEMTKSLKTTLTRAFEMHVNIVKGYDLLGQNRLPLLSVQPGSQEELEPVCSEESLLSAKGEASASSCIKLLQKRVDKQEEQISQLRDELAQLRHRISQKDNDKNLNEDDKAQECALAIPSLPPTEKSERYRSTSTISSEKHYHSSSASSTSVRSARTSRLRNNSKPSHHSARDGSTGKTETAVLRDDPRHQESDKFRLMKLITNKIASSYLKRAVTRSESESSVDSERTRNGRSKRHKSGYNSRSISRQRRRSYSPRKKRQHRSNSYRST